MGNIIDLTGKVYGRLTVISFHGVEKHNARWLCLCSCGKETVASCNTLRSNLVKSCGCSKGGVNKIHGDANRKIKEYTAWQKIKSRCLSHKDPAYKDYGGRGITICEEWENSYASFLNCVGRAPGPMYSIDRIRNNGNYEPGNVRWATRKEQCNNRRSNFFIEFRGQTKTLAEWCDVLNLNRQTIWNRLKGRGLSPEIALTKPILKYPKKDA